MSMKKSSDTIGSILKWNIKVQGNVEDAVAVSSAPMGIRNGTSHFIFMDTTDVARNESKQIKEYH
jgi:hypothetical protein